MNSPIVPKPGAPWESRSVVDQFLRDWDREWMTLKELTEYERMSDKPVYRPCKFHSTETLVPEVQNIQWFRGLLHVKHEVAVYDGDQDTAFSAIRVCQTLEHSLAAEPCIVSQIVRSVVGRTACKMIADSLRYDQLIETQLDEIEVELEHFGPIPEMFRLAMIGERALLLPVFSDPSLAAAAMGLHDTLDRIDLSGRGVDGLYFLDKMQTAIDLPTDDTGDFKQTACDVEAMIQNESREGGHSFEQKRRFAISLLPAFQRYAEILVSYSEEIELTKLAIAERRRRDSLQLPK